MKYVLMLLTISTLTIAALFGSISNEFERHPKVDQKLLEISTPFDGKIEIEFLEATFDTAHKEATTSMDSSTRP